MNYDAKLGFGRVLKRSAQMSHFERFIFGSDFVPNPNRILVPHTPTPDPLLGLVPEPQFV